LWLAKPERGLKTQSLRDDMSEAEPIFTALAELSTRQITETRVATGMAENQTAAKAGGKIAKRARLELEAKTGKKVVTGESYLTPRLVKPASLTGRISSMQFDRNAFRQVIAVR